MICVNVKVLLIHINALVYYKNSCIFVKEIITKKNVMTTSNNNIEFQGILISYDESQTVGNCIDLGFGTDKAKNIIADMREKGIDYLSHRKLEKYRNS